MPCCFTFFFRENESSESRCYVLYVIYFSYLVRQLSCSLLKLLKRQERILPAAYLPSGDFAIRGALNLDKARVKRQGTFKKLGYSEE